MLLAICRMPFPLCRPSSSYIPYTPYISARMEKSSAIICYLGKISGLYPTDDHLLAARMDMLLCGEADMFTGLSVATYHERFGFGSLDEAAVSAVRAAVASETLPRHLRQLEAILASYGDASSSGWLANTPSPSVVDFVYAPRLTWLQVDMTMTT